ncbi:MAG: hydantoinase/oxoprolinase family protein [Pseudomonadales bacterium]|nr:hydantoinase/oxoprolinase family protein [Pseudomonadales bacterium]
MLLGIDTGGTFTDFVLVTSAGMQVHKLLSTPHAPAKAILQGIEELNLMSAAKNGELTIIHGSTVATNAALEEKGVKTVFITNRGLSDMLSIGRQTRAELYNLCPYPTNPPVPKSHCLETGGRLNHQGNIIEPLTQDDLKSLIQHIQRLNPAAVAINLLYSFIDDSHEKAIEAALPKDLFISRSSYVLPEYKEYERGMATWLNASLGPIVSDYLTQLEAELSPCTIRIMQSSGGTMNIESAAKQAVRLLLSGPAGGLAAAQFIGHLVQDKKNQLITFDMGGTSTDVALIDGQLTLTNESKIGNYPVAVPMVNMHTIGAGGGSIAFIDKGGLLQVGPQSAGSEPGPASYGRGGTLATVTDANVVLGRLRPSLFLGGKMSLDTEKADTVMDELANSLGLSPLETAFGIISIANDHMSRALRVISVQKGYDPKNFQLCCFGGAGGLHVCALANALDIPKAIIPINGGVLSALGMLVAPRERQLSITHQCLLSQVSEPDLTPLIQQLENRGRQALMAEGISQSKIQRSVSLDLRYKGQTHTLNTKYDQSIKRAIERATEIFHQQHKTRYGHALNLDVELINIRVGVSAASDPLTLPNLSNAQASENTNPSDPIPLDVISLRYFNDTNQGTGPDNNQGPPQEKATLLETPIYQRDHLEPGHIIKGPALVAETVSTTLIEPHWWATVDKWGNLLLEKKTTEKQKLKYKESV